METMFDHYAQDIEKLCDMVSHVATCDRCLIFKFCDTCTELLFCGQVWELWLMSEEEC